MIIHLIAAARPNFMKIAPLYHALVKESWAQPVIVHTGQHYDAAMSDAFFENLRLPPPDIHLGIGSGTHAEQTGNVMIAYEKVLRTKTPDLVVVVGDVNSTMAATIASAKLGMRVAHLEAGLRSFDRTMPEEINRIVTDSLADLLWTPSADGDENLLKEGVPPEKIERVGNIMIDSLEMMRSAIEGTGFYQTLGLIPGEYAVVTLHRPSNVDSAGNLEALLLSLRNIAETIPLVFPVHPRTRKNWENFGLSGILARCEAVHLTEPLPYIPFMNLVFNCRLAITDSGGLQEETTYLGIPCVTLRPNTERPITITEGTNRLCSNEDVERMTRAVLSTETRRMPPPELWDGRTAFRVAQSIRTRLA
jgi:UDP-N-acetylglucosamine 2-epimerase (non-hydrolysing)